MLLKIQKAFQSGKLNSFISNLINAYQNDIVIFDNNIQYQFTTTYSQKKGNNIYVVFILF